MDRASCHSKTFFVDSNKDGFNRPVIYFKLAMFTCTEHFILKGICILKNNLWFLFEKCIYVPVHVPMVQYLLAIQQDLQANGLTATPLGVSDRLL